MPGTAAVAVCELVGKRGSVTYRDIREALGVSALELDAALQGLAAQGKVRHVGGRFHLAGEPLTPVSDNLDQQPIVLGMRRHCLGCGKRLAGRRFADDVTLTCKLCVRAQRRVHGREALAFERLERLL